MLVFHTALLSTSWFILYKKLDKTLQESKGSKDNLNNKIEELQGMVANVSAFVLNSDKAQEKTHSQVAATLSKISLLLEKDHPESLETNKDKIQTKSTDDSNGNLKDPSRLISPQSDSPLLPSAQIKKSNIDSSVDLKNDLEYFEKYKEDIYKSKKPEIDNSSVNELKSLENEILFALRRLEKTKSHLDVEIEQEQEQENKNKAT
ncbi:MAG: hypothetical protein H0X50_00685 [Nitrosopumilus sp.]|nr:hypothetical protein [Nitrosopumilus sp.]